MKNETLIKYCEPILKEKFGKHTSLDKHPLPVDVKYSAQQKFRQKAVWSIVSLGDKAFDFTVHGCGQTAQEALKSAGLGGCIEDLAEKLKKEAEGGKWN